MAKYKVEIAGSESPIYREGFTIYRVNSNQDYFNQRKKREGLENQFFAPLDTKIPRYQKLKKIVRLLKDYGWELKEK